MITHVHKVKHLANRAMALYIRKKDSIRSQFIQSIIASMQEAG